MSIIGLLAVTFSCATQRAMWRQIGPYTERWPSRARSALAAGGTCLLSVMKTYRPAFLHPGKAADAERLYRCEKPDWLDCFSSARGRTRERLSGLMGIFPISGRATRAYWPARGRVRCPWPALAEPGGSSVWHKPAEKTFVQAGPIPPPAWPAQRAGAALQAQLALVASTHA